MFEIKCNGNLVATAETLDEAEAKREEGLARGPMSRINHPLQRARFTAQWTITEPEIVEATQLAEQEKLEDAPVGNGVIETAIDLGGETTSPNPTAEDVMAVADAAVKQGDVVA